MQQHAEQRASGGRRLRVHRRVRPAQLRFRPRGRRLRPTSTVHATRPRKGARAGRCRERAQLTGPSRVSDRDANGRVDRGWSGGERGASLAGTWWSRPADAPDGTRGDAPARPRRGVRAASRDRVRRAAGERRPNRARAARHAAGDRARGHGRGDARRRRAAGRLRADQELGLVRPERRIGAGRARRARRRGRHGRRRGRLRPAAVAAHARLVRADQPPGTGDGRLRRGSGHRLRDPGRAARQLGHRRVHAAGRRPGPTGSAARAAPAGKRRHRRRRPLREPGRRVGGPARQGPDVPDELRHVRERLRAGVALPGRNDVLRRAGPADAALRRAHGVHATGVRPLHRARASAARVAGPAPVPAAGRARPGRRLGARKGASGRPARSRDARGLGARRARPLPLRDRSPERRALPAAHGGGVRPDPHGRRRPPAGVRVQRKRLEADRAPHGAGPLLPRPARARRRVRLVRAVVARAHDHPLAHGRRRCASSLRGRWRG